MSISGKDYLRNEEGKIICSADGYPIINPEKGCLIGNREPKFLMGFSSNFSYRDLSVSFLLDIRKGGEVMNVTGRNLMENGMSKAYETYRNRQVVIDGVVQQADGSYVPNTNPIILDRVTLGNYIFPVSSNYIEDGSYIRLSYVTVGYDFSRFLKKTPIKGLRVSVTGRNLFLFTKYTGGDPRVNSDPSKGGAGNFGIDNYTVPTPRSFNFSINATF